MVFFPRIDCFDLTSLRLIKRRTWNFHPAFTLPFKSSAQYLLFGMSPEKSLMPQILAKMEPYVSPQTLAEIQNYRNFISEMFIPTCFVVFVPVFFISRILCVVNSSKGTFTIFKVVVFIVTTAVFNSILNLCFIILIAYYPRYINKFKKTFFWD